LPLECPTRLVDLLPDPAELTCELIVVECLSAEEFDHTVLKDHGASPFLIRAVYGRWTSAQGSIRVGGGCPV